MISPSSAAAQYVENMTPQQHKDLETSLRPGHDSMSGFLAENESLSASAARKAQVLKDHGVTFDALADRIEALEELENRNAFSEQFGVKVSRYRGFQTCPFPNCRELGSTDIHVTQKATGKQLTIPALMPHLARDHHFLEGDVPYGLDPQQAIEVLEMHKPLASPKDTKPTGEPAADTDAYGRGKYRGQA